jgi:hypothetical protein
VQRSAATKTAAAETRASRLPGGRVVLCQEIDHARFVCISFSLLSLYNDMMSVCALLKLLSFLFFGIFFFFSSIVTEHCSETIAMVPPLLAALRSPLEPGALAHAATMTLRRAIKSAISAGIQLWNSGDTKSKFSTKIKPNESILL